MILISYLKKSWFKKNRKDFNYSDIINNYYNNKNILDKMYLTNNIMESIHSKLNFYLPKHKTTIYYFINTLESIILNVKLK